MSENRDLLRSVRGSIDDIDMAMDYMEQSVLSFSPTESTRTRKSSLSSDLTLVSLRSAEMTQTPATKTQSASVETESIIFFADSRKLQDYSQKTNASDVDSREKNVRINQSTNIYKNDISQFKFY